MRRLTKIQNGIQNKESGKMSSPTEKTHDIYDPTHILPPAPKKLPPKSKESKTTLEKLKLTAIQPQAKVKPSNWKDWKDVKVVKKPETSSKGADKINQKLAERNALILPSDKEAEPSNPGSPSVTWILGDSDSLDVLTEPRKFLFQIERNPSTLGASVYKSYDVFLKDGERIFTIVNRSSREEQEEFTEYRMIGRDGTVALVFHQPVATWGDEDCCYCCPRPHESDGIRVILNDREVGFITVKDCAPKPCIFSGFRARPWCSRYHVSYLIQYIDGDLEIQTATTRACSNYGLEVISENGKLLGEISIAPNSNRKVNRQASPDFMLALTNVYIHQHGKGVLLGLAIRHQLNVLLAHKLPPAAYKFGFSSSPAKQKRPKPTSI